WAPWCASRRAVASPMPLLAPVMRMILPLMFDMSLPPHGFDLAAPFVLRDKTIATGAVGVTSILSRACLILALLSPGFGPAVRSVDVVGQLPQPAMVAAVEHEAQAWQRLQFGLVQFLFAAGLLLELAAQAEVGEVFVEVSQRGVAQSMVETHDEALLEAPAGVEVAIEIGDFPRGLLGILDQAHQAHVVGQDVAVVDQLPAHELQRILPERAARLVEQHHRHQRALAGLDQGEYFQCLVQGAEAARAE